MPSWNQVVGFLTDWEGLRPRYEYENLAFGPFADGLLQSGRTAPHMSGLALLEAIPEGVLQEWADPNNADGDGISGRANSVWDATAGGMRTGRFGWKAEQPSVRQQVAAALNGDMGITSPIFGDQNCPAPQVDCVSAPNGGEPEITLENFDKLVFYSATIFFEPDWPRRFVGPALEPQLAPVGASPLGPLQKIGFTVLAAHFAFHGT